MIASVTHAICRAVLALGAALAATPALVPLSPLEATAQGAASGPTHPAIAADRQPLEAEWDRGLRDGRAGRSLDRALRVFRRSLGSDSSLLLLHPRLLARLAGYEAGRQRLAGSAYEQVRREQIDRAVAGADRIRLSVELEVRPRLSGIVMRDANPADMKGVKAEMRVSRRVYAARRRPGDVPFQALTGYFEYDPYSGEDPRPRVETPGGLPNRGPEKHFYEYYRGQFELEFDTLGPDGAPRVTAEDREFQIILQGRFGRHTATYRLSDLLKPIP